MLKFIFGYFTACLFRSRKTDSMPLKDTTPVQQDGNYITFSVLIFGYVLFAAAIVFCIVLFYRVATFFEIF